MRIQLMKAIVHTESNLYLFLEMTSTNSMKVSVLTQEVRNSLVQNVPVKCLVKRVIARNKHCQKLA